jgi:hypothetical protein
MLFGKVHHPDDGSLCNNQAISATAEPFVDCWPLMSAGLLSVIVCVWEEARARSKSMEQLDRERMSMGRHKGVHLCVCCPASGASG